MAADARESIKRDTAMETELEESVPFIDFEENKHELEENKLILEDC